MRNLRKLTAAVLAIALVLTSMTAAFAASTTNEFEAQATVLKDLGIWAGDADGNLLLDQGLSRVQGAVLVLKTVLLKTDEDQAAADKSTLSTYADAKAVPAWATGWMALAVEAGVLKGTDKNELLANGPLYGKDLASMFNNALKLTNDYAKAVELLAAASAGTLVDAALVAKLTDAKLTRDAASAIVFDALTATAKDATKTVIATYVGTDADKKAVAVEAGLMTDVNTALVVDTAISVANNKVKVELKDAAEATAADFAIVKKGTTTAVAIKNVVKESDKVYVLETEALVGGTSYTLTANAKSVNFTGIVADTSVPTIVKVSGKDANKFEVEYSDKMDFATSTDVANYTFDKSVKVVKAELNGDRNKVTLITDTAKRNSVYTVTVQNVTNSDGKVISKASRKVTAVEDKVTPKLTGVKVQNNRLIILTFTETSGMDKASVETLANYSINDLNVLTATAYDITPDDDLYDTVVLTTDEQTANKSYTLTLENLVDAGVLANPLGKVTRTFRGATEDKTSPTVKASSVSASNNNEVVVDFTENNAMSVESLQDISNYAITYGSSGDVLEVISAKAASTTYPDLYSNRKVTLTTAPQEIGKNYKLEVKGVQDEFGNALKTKGGSSTAYTTYSFVGSIVDVKPATVTSVDYISDTRVDLYFVEGLKESIAEDPTNYSINKDIGAPIKANYKETNGKFIVELTTQKLSANTTYTVTINNVEDTHGNAMQNAESKFVATSSDLDLTAPSINYIQSSNTREIQVNFDESIVTQPDKIVVSAYTDNAFTGTAYTLTYAGKADGKKTVIYNSLTDLPVGSYKIMSVHNLVSGTIVQNRVNFADEAGNKLVITASVTAPAIGDRYAFDATSIENEVAKVEYIEQVNVKKLKVVFTEPVKSTDPKLVKIDTDDGDDFFTEWYYEHPSKIAVDKDITIDFSALAEDTNGIDVQDTNPNGENSALYTFKGYLEDNSDPVISGVEATSNRKIVITYDEDLSLPGSYKVLKLNETTGNKDYWFTLPGTKDGNKVTVTAPSNLSSATTYYLEVVSGATDVAGNKEDSSTTQYDFPGSDVIVSDFVNGVSIINAELIKVSATKNMDEILVTTTDTIGGVTTTSSIGYAGPTVGDDEVEVNLWAPVLAGRSYNVEVTYSDGTAGNYVFKGITPDMGLKLVTGAGNTAKLDFIDAEIASYTYEAITYDTNIYLTGVAGTSEVTFTGANATEIDGTTPAVMNLAAGQLVYVVVRNSSGIAVYAQQVIIE